VLVRIPELIGPSRRTVATGVAFAHRSFCPASVSQPVSHSPSELGAQTDGRPVTTGRPAPAKRLVLGAKSGVVATVVMTLFRLPISHSPPPPATLLAKLLGGEPEDHTLGALPLHLIYGVAAGVAYAAASPLDPDESDVRAERRGVIRGAAFGLGLSAFGKRVLLEGLLGMDLDADERFVFHVGHLVYGLTLGAWLGSATGDG